MKVEILYFAGCPNWQDAGERVRAASETAEVQDIEIEYRRVETDDEAAALPFAGSPTILVDGADAFDDAVPVTELACRLYQTESGLAGLPSIEQLADSLRRKSEAARR
ncbi:alkylmercury lyase [Rhodococcus sp. NPDC059234]|uniref:DF family (seleno)protein n=1 Tax=Rhodococcus sp. NPDC059234 TaxID=3346781 RepID=UPI0036705C4B